MRLSSSWAVPVSSSSRPVSTCSRASARSASPCSSSARPSSSWVRPSARSSAVASSWAWLSKGSTASTSGMAFHCSTTSATDARCSSVNGSSVVKTTVPVVPEASGISSRSVSSTVSNRLPGMEMSLVRGFISARAPVATIARMATQAATTPHR
ncbi:hypothetical protein ACFPT5_19695 [Ornithinimicrobium kibberense]